MTGSARRIGVLLMTYGSPATLADVPEYLSKVRGGRAASPEVVDEFTRRYRVIGGSPLIEITRQQADALESLLGPSAAVEIGMRFSAPTIAYGLQRLAANGVERVVGIIMSPQYSELIMAGYRRELEAARAGMSGSSPAVTIAGAWHREPLFVDALGDRVNAALKRLAHEDGESVPVLFTAHSLPKRVADREPDYIGQLMETAASVAGHAGLPRESWQFCWQSAGHEPGEWMKPDFADLLPVLRDRGHRSVLVAPVQFLADHLEVLYDIDIAAREQAETAGLRLERTESLNCEPRFIRALAAVVAANA